MFWLKMSKYKFISFNNNATGFKVKYYFTPLEQYVNFSKTAVL